MNRILLVDDEPNLLAGMQRLIRSLDLRCECLLAANGAEGLACARETLPDVIVTDIRMPKMSGLELLSALKADPATQRIPVIVLTGHGDSGAKQTALELGAQDFIDKPAVPAEFAARLRSMFKLKEYEDQLRERNKILERQVMQLQKVENIGFLAAGFSHDLRNILGAVVGHIELAAASAGVPEAAKVRLQTAAEAAVHAADLSRQMLSMSKPATEHTILCDMGTLVSDSMKLLAVSIRPDIVIEWEAPNTDTTFMGIPMQIHQVLMNLFINAVHAMPGIGRLVIRVDRLATISPDADQSQPGPVVRLQVRDTGVGMDPATVEHIFEPYFTTRPEGQGTGLGLSVIQQIVRDHGGTISVESAPGRGTTFTLCFPAAVIEREQNSHREGESGVFDQAANPVR